MLARVVPTDVQARPGLRAVATVFLRRRPFVVAPMFAAVLLALVLGPGPRAQVAAVAGFASVALLFFASEAWRGTRRLVEAGTLRVSLIVTLVGIGVASAATGGALSPLVFMIFAPVVVGFAAFGRGTTSNALLILAVAVLVILAVLPRGVPFPAFAEDTRRWLVVVCAVDALVLLRLGVVALTDAHRAAANAAAGAGDDVIASAAARTASLEAMGAKVAHEVKNPLSAIRGLVEVLAEKTSEPRDQKRLAVVLGEVDRIDEILRGYLALARPLDQLDRQRCDLDQLVREVAAVVEARAERAGVALSVDGASTAIDGDPRRLKEAVLNLALNAIDATPAGGRIQLRTSSGRAGVVVSVEDSGVGMDAARLAAAGTPFQTGGGGTGLGLALARQTAEQHGGALELDSAPGRGTVVRLRLPGGAS